MDHRKARRGTDSESVSLADPAERTPDSATFELVIHGVLRNSREARQMSTVRSFVSTLLPWLAARWNQADRLAEAEISKRENESIEIQMNALRSFQESRKLRAEADRLSARDELGVVDVATDTAGLLTPEVKTQIRKIDRMVQALNRQHGLTIRVVRRDTVEEGD